MGQTKKCKFCDKPVPIEQKGNRLYFYEHYDFDKNRPCAGSKRKVRS
jgi:hypothetical protein